MFPDGTKAWDSGYRSEWGAEKILKWLQSNA